MALFKCCSLLQLLTFFCPFRAFSLYDSTVFSQVIYRFILVIVLILVTVFFLKITALLLCLWVFLGMTSLLFRAIFKVNFLSLLRIYVMK